MNDNNQSNEREELFKKISSLRDFSNTTDQLFAEYKKYGMQSIPERDFTDELVFKIIEYNPLDFRFLPDLYKSKREYALLAASLDGWVLQYLPQFNNDFEIVLAAVSNVGTVLMFASNELKDNKDRCMAAIKTNKVAINFVSPRLASDVELIEYVNNPDNYDEFGHGLNDGPIR